MGYEWIQISRPAKNQTLTSYPEITTDIGINQVSAHLPIAVAVGA
jgi:hypothetical protein